MSNCSAKKEARRKRAAGPQAWEEEGNYPGVVAVLACGAAHEQPVVEPQVSHFRQVPLRTRVKLAQLGQGSPSYPLSRASLA